MYDVRQEKPPSPDDLARADEARRRTSLVPVFTVFGFGAVVVLVAFSCAGVAGLFTLVAIAAVVGFVALHYLAWGWWLGNRIRRQEAIDEEQNRANR